MTIDERERIKGLIDDWVFNLAREYENATPEMQRILEDDYVCDEEWDTLLDDIEKVLDGD